MAIEYLVSFSHSVTVASCFLSLQFFLLEHYLTSSKWGVVFLFSCSSILSFVGCLVPFLFQIFCCFPVKVKIFSESSLPLSCCSCCTLFCHVGTVRFCILSFLFLVSGSEVYRRLASWWQDKITRNRHCICISKCMGYSLQENYQPRKEIWLWLGICRSHFVILYSELTIETNHLQRICRVTTYNYLHYNNFIF